MAGTIYSGTYFSGIVLGNPATQLPATIAASGYVTNTTTLHNGDGIYGYSGTAWTLANLGMVRAGASGDGVQFESGGYVANAGSISANSRGVEIDNALGTVVNSGVINGGTGIYLQAGGTITNTGAIFAFFTGIEAGSRGSATITNLGTISAASPTTGISLDDGGTIVNGGAGATAALITAYGSVLDLSGAPGTVTNYGTILSSGVDAAAGVYLQAGGAVTNRAGALIKAETSAVEINGSGTVVNFGTITSTGTYSYLSGVILGLSGVESPPVGNSTLINAGTISGASGTAVSFHGSGNRLILDPGAVFSGIVNGGTANDTLELAAGAGSGTLSGFGTSFAGFNTLTVDSGASWQLAAGNTIASGITLTDFGTLANAGAIASPVTLFPSGSLSNSGAITGTVILVTSGTLDNLAGGLISSAGTAVQGYGADSTILNAGTISGASGTAVAFYRDNNRLIVDPGAVFNGVVSVTGATVNNTLELAAGSGSGTIDTTFSGFNTLQEDASASWVVPGSFTFANGTIAAGASLTESGPLTFTGSLSNSGAIAAAVTLTAGASLTNQAGGTISGAGDAVFGSGGSATVVNAGTISGAGGTAVAFAGTGNRLVVDPGAVFSGLVEGGTGSDTLELAAGGGPGTLSGLGASFTGFTTVAVDPAAVWQISGAPAAPAAFINDGTIALGPGGLVFGAVSEDSGSSGVIDMTASGTAEFTSTVAPGQTVVFTGASGLARLDEPSGFAGAIADFQAGDTLDLAGVAADGYTYSGGVLSLTEGGAAVAALKVTTPYASTAFTLAADGAGGTLITDRGALTGSVVLGTAQERVALPADTAVARFSDGDTADIASGFAATIVWGDGVTNAGTITGGAGAFTVSGGHSFADEGSYPLAVTVVRTADDTRLDLAGTVTATEGDALSPGTAGLTVIAGRTFSGTVATFADTDTTAPAADFTATIAWGDGVTSTGTVSGGSGAFTVSGSHPYTTAGTRPLSVTLADDPPGTATATATGVAAVVPGNIFSGVYPNGILLNNPAIESPPTITSTAYVTNTAGRDSVYAAAGFAWTLATYGRIAGPGDGIGFAASGVIDNSGSIAGSNGIDLAAGGTLTNRGTVAGSANAGVYMGGGGTVLNGAGGATGALLTGRYGVAIGSGAGSGVFAVNLATIYGTNIGFAAGDAIGNTLVNAGTIGGGSGTAIQFGGSGDLLVIDPHAVFSGRVNGGGGYDTIELAAGGGVGALLGLGTRFHNFAAVGVDPGAVWRLAGAPAAAPVVANDGRIIVGGGRHLTLGAVGEDAGMSGVIAVRAGGTLAFAGSVDAQQTVRFADGTGTLILDDPQDFGATIQGFRSGDVIDLAHTTADGFTYADGALTLTSGGNPTASVALSGTLGASQFALAPDGRGGTDVTAAAGQLFAFTFAYADGDAYYSGTVADDGSLGYAAIVASGNPTISEPNGTYTLASAGPATTQSPGAVTVTSYTASPPEANAAQSYVPLATSLGQFDGHAGLGSEADSVQVNGTLFAFSPSLEFHPLLAS